MLDAESRDEEGVVPVNVIHLVWFSIRRITPRRRDRFSQRAGAENRAGYKIVSLVIFSMFEEIDRAD